MSVSAVCLKVGMSRQNYYARRRERQVDDGLVVSLVEAERKLQPRLGARKLLFLYQPVWEQAGITLGRDWFIEVLRAPDLLLEPKPAEYPGTTNSWHCLPVFHNRIKGLEVTKPNEVWVGDLTYIRTGEGYLYLSLLTDKCSRKVVGYHSGETLEAGGLSQSMTEQDHCAENALAERMNGILKGEYGLGVKFKTKAQARAAIDQAVYLYNHRRPHTSLGYQTPQAVHSLAA